MSNQQHKKRPLLRRVLDFLGVHGRAPVVPARRNGKRAPKVMPCAVNDAFALREGKAAQATLRDGDAKLDLESLGRLKSEIDRALSHANGDSAAPPICNDWGQRSLARSERLDAELLVVFIDEAHEVLATIGRHLQMLRNKPGNCDYLTTIRRCFHTLKGSGRMVGLDDLGDAAWAMESTFNRWLELGWSATPVLLSLIGSAHWEFSAWVRQIELWTNANLSVAAPKQGVTACG
jgi:HPt (histidine-containing phosphotransfer) domain-containing protein